MRPVTQSVPVGRLTTPLESYSKFRRLTIVHAAMMGGDAAMVVALANSLFFSIDLDEARSRVLLFLVLSFAPFLLVAPLIGPVLDRVAGGRRAVIQFVACSRVVLSVLMALFIDNLALFPLVFIALVLQKTYIVSKQAIVPSVVRNERDLVEANSKLGLIAGLVGVVVIVPAGIIQLTPAQGSGTLAYSAIIFGVALLASTWLAADVVAAHDAGAAEKIQLHSTRVQVGALSMMILRGAAGFMLFLLAFWLRTKDNGTAWFGLALAAATAGSAVGNAIAPRLRARRDESTMLIGSLAGVAVAGLLAALVGGIPALVGLAFVTNLGASIGRLGFESMVQHDAPQANRGRAFANFETRFQLTWAAAGLIPVVIHLSGAIGALVVGVAGAGGVAYTVLRPRITS